MRDKMRIKNAEIRVIERERVTDDTSDGCAPSP